MTVPALRCSQLTQVYRVGSSEVIALQGLDLEIEPGEMVAVVGASGSGKSTLLRVSSGLLRPTGGRVTVGGLDLGSAPRSALDRYRRNDLGFVWQDSGRNLVPHLTARQNVRLPLDLDGRRDAKAHADRLLSQVGLRDRADHRPVELSGGEQQRVALAMALAHEPALLLADEPTGALDSTTTNEVFELMRSIGHERGLTQVIVSHDADVARHVDRVVSIRDGRVAAEQRWVGDDEDGSVEEVLVIDSIGRLQLSDEQRAALGGSSLVRADLTDGVLEIRAADGLDNGASDE